MADLIGTSLGAYRILEQIGQGGMATVYKAYQSGMDRLVAVKVLAEHFARDPNFEQRFEQEARVIAHLEHRNIVPIYDFGEQEGVAYLVMRYLQAGTVRDIMAHGPLPLLDVARLMNDIASALDYAHAQGIIHRDVKPNNILVDKQGHAYLTDFGLAKVIEAASDITGSASMVGTPAYMAPEQTLGRPATPKTDVYALGVMLYEMAVGRPPYESSLPMAVALMHVQAPLPSPRDVNPSISEAVERILIKALAKDPADRFASAGELAQTLEITVQAEAPTEPHLPRLLTELANTVASTKGSEELTVDVRAEIRRLDTTERRQRLLRLAPGFVSVAAIVGLVVALMFSLSTASQERRAAEQTATALNGLFAQLGEAQTAAALGNRAEFEPTVAFLQTDVAAALTAGAPAPNTNTSAPPTPTHTALPTRTRTPTLENTATATPSRTVTRVRQTTRVSPSPTFTPLLTETSRPPDVPEPDPTSIPSESPTETPMPTSTETLTPDPYPVPTDTPSESTPTETVTPIPTTPCADGC